MSILRKNIGIFTGVAAGIIDVIPMIIQKLPIPADLSAFMTWVVIGFVISKIDIGFTGAQKGLVTAVIIVAPTAALIAGSEPQSLLPVAVMTIILGSLCGLIIEKYKN